MKKNILLIVITLFVSVSTFAQYCGGSGSSVCTPAGPYPQLGFYPPYDSAACGIIGVPYDEKIDMQIPATTLYNGLTANINWIRVDSVRNLPCGLCWRTNNSNNQFNGNSTGCVRISGTTFDVPGQYKMRIIITINATVGFLPVTLTNQNADDFGIKYFARVIPAAGVTCPPVDTLAVGLTASVPGAITTPTISGNTSICTGASTTLTAGGGSYHTYKWSTGALTSAITVNTLGTYTVTVYGNCNSATAAVNVTTPTVTTTITSSGPTTFCAGGSVTLDAGAGFSSYNWSNGGTGQTIVATQSNTYTTTVTQNGCTGTSNTVTVTVNPIPAPTLTANGPTTFCSGGNVTLNAGSNFSSYLWNTGETTSTINVTADGFYSAVVAQNGCSGSSDTVEVVVTASNLTPTITASASFNICPGGVTTLDAGAGYDTYLWNDNSTSQTLQVNTGGDYLVTVTQSTCSGEDSVTVIEDNFEVPVSIQPSSPLAICEGTTVTLNSGTGFDSYLWSTGELSSSIQTDTAGIYIVTVSSNACVGTDTVEVTVIPLPSTTIAPSGTVSICQGESVTLDAGVGFDNYLWSNNSTTQTVEISSSETLNVTVTKDGCSEVSSNAVTVQVNSLPQASVSVTNIDGANFYLIASPSAGVSYVWQYALSLDTTGQIITLPFDNDSVDVDCLGNGGYYRVVVKNSTDCTDTSGFAYVPVCVGLRGEKANLSLSVFPNPVNDRLNINYHLQTESVVSLVATDVTGRVVMNLFNEVQSVGPHKFQVPINHLAPGVYFLNLSNKQGSVTVRVIKE